MNDTSLSWPDILLEALKQSGACGADLLQSVNTDVQYDHISKRQEFLIFALVPTCVLMLIIVSWLLGGQGRTQAEIAQSVALLAVFLGGGNRFIRGIQDLFLRRCVTVDVFVSVALAAAMAIGEFLSAAIVIFIMAVSGAVEGYTMDKSTRSIQRFLGLAPQTATLLVDGREQVIEIEAIGVGDQIVVTPGSRIPADGIVADGFADVNESVITGEALPVAKQTGSQVFAGTLNESGRLVIRVTKEVNDTVFAQIAQMVNASQSNQAPIQRTVDRFTTWYLPIILAAAIIGYLITRDMQSAVSILLVAAPCALAIGTPTAVSAAMANMTRKGVFIKGGAYFEAAGELDVLMLDKTGTLTTGVPTVSEIWTVNGARTDEVLYWAASVERDSSHPFARALKREAEQKKVALGKVSDFVSITGSGVRAAVDGAAVAVGRPEYIKGLCSNSSDMMEFAEDERSIVAVSVDGRLCGIVQFEDQLRTNAKQSAGAILFNFCHSMVYVTIGLFMYFSAEKKGLKQIEAKNTGGGG
ncbi:MAG: cation-translocating P-type ATPase [Clostridiales bacterium]|nr:cation-translocating P-type ATPase [Clostridiales bacterium]